MSISSFWENFFKNKSPIWLHVKFAHSMKEWVSPHKICLFFNNVLGVLTLINEFKKILIRKCKTKVISHLERFLPIWPWFDLRRSLKVKYKYPKSKANTMRMIFILGHEMPQMNGFWDISIFMAPINKHFRIQNLSEPKFFSENIPGVLKHILTRRWTKSDKTNCIIYFFVRSQPYLDTKMEHFERIYRYPAIKSLF